MQFTSLKAYLKPGTVFRDSYREWGVEQVEYNSSSTPFFWKGKTRLLGEISWSTIECHLWPLDDSAYRELTITKLGGTPLKLEDLI